MHILSKFRVMLYPPYRPMPQNVKDVSVKSKCPTKSPKLKVIQIKLSTLDVLHGTEEKI
jgi:hypothetical protein